MPKTYLVSDLIGKPLIAKVATKLYRLPSDTAKSYASVAANQPLGTLFSYINPSVNTTSLWFMFYDSNNKPYYTKYASNSLKPLDLQKSGIDDQETKNKKKQQEIDLQEKGAIRFYIEKYAPFIIAGLFLLPLAKKLIDKKL